MAFRRDHGRNRLSSSRIMGYRAAVVGTVFIAACAVVYYMHPDSQSARSLALHPATQEARQLANELRSVHTISAASVPHGRDALAGQVEDAVRVGSTAQPTDAARTDGDGASGGDGLAADVSQPDDHPESQVAPSDALLPNGITVAQREQMILEAEGMSTLASVDMAARIYNMPGDPIYPAGGPVESIELRAAPDDAPVPTERGKYHVVVAAGPSVYHKWQVLTNYHSYLKAKAADPEGPMGGYTRLLEADVIDNLIHLVPTILVKPVPRLNHHDGTELQINRPFAYTQWLIKVHIPEEFIFTVEPDQVFLRPPPLLATPMTVAVFPLHAVDCRSERMAPFCGRSKVNADRVASADVPRTSSAPMMVSKEVLARLVPLWDVNTRHLFTDPEAKQAMGGAVEGYAFSLAAANLLPRLGVELDYHRELLLEPPFAEKSMKVETCGNFKAQPRECPGGKRGPETARDAVLVHLKHAQNYDASGNIATNKRGEYHFDKRSYAHAFPAAPLPLPPPDAPQSIIYAIQSINEAAAATPLWKAYESPDAPAPADPAGEPTVLSTEQRRLRDNQRVRAEAAASSARAAADAQRELLPVTLLPRGGPLSALLLPQDAHHAPALGKYHVVVPTDTLLSSRWGVLASYHAYKKAREADVDGPMGGFTRVLTTKQPDDIAHLVPTVLVDDLPPDIDPELNHRQIRRAWALSQWLSLAHVPEEFVLVLDPDMLIVRQPPAPRSPSNLVLWPDAHVDCRQPQHAALCNSTDLNPSGLRADAVPRAGSAPSIMHKDVLAELLPAWDAALRRLPGYADALERRPLSAAAAHAFALSAAALAAARGLQFEYHAELQVVPPLHDSLTVDTCQHLDTLPCQPECPYETTSLQSSRDASIIHYSSPIDLNYAGEHATGNNVTYHWSKHDFRLSFPPVPYPQPPDGSPDTVVELIGLINEAGASLPLWRAYVTPTLLTPPPGPPLRGAAPGDASPPQLGQR